MRDFNARVRSYCAKHFVDFNAWMHLFMGLGIAWLVSLTWHYAIHPLVLGIVFLVAGIAMHVYAGRTTG